MKTFHTQKQTQTEHISIGEMQHHAANNTVII